MRVYKYLNEKYKTNWFSGEVYINAFGGVRKFENGAINDNQEGVIHNYSGKEELTFESSNPDHKKQLDNLRNFHGIDVQDDSKITLINTNFSHALDAYMCCVTTERNDDYWRNNITIDQGGPYNSCIEISNFEEFAIQLRSALFKEDNNIGNGYIGEVFFESNKGVFANNTTKHPNAFRKPEADCFKQQKEVRLVVESRLTHTLTPKTVYLDINKLVKDGLIIFVS